MNEVLLIAGMAAVTMATRIPVLIILTRRKLPVGIERALRYVPPAMLSAIILPYVLLPSGEPNFQLSNAPLIASVIAVLVSWRTRNLLLTIVVGMSALLVWRALF